MQSDLLTVAARCYFIRRQWVTINPIHSAAVATAAATVCPVSLQIQQWDSHSLWSWPRISSSSHRVQWSIRPI